MNQLGKEQLDLFEGVQLPTLQIKYLLFRSLYEWMLVFCCIQFSSYLDFIDVFLR